MQERAEGRGPRTSPLRLTPGDRTSRDNGPEYGLSKTGEVTYYYTKIRTKWGKQDSDGSGVRSQRGHREPSWCHSWLCTYEDDTDLILDYDPPGYRAPGQETWVSND